MISNCPTCDTYQNRQLSETLSPTKSPELPRTEIASDLFEWKRAHHIVTVDYYSKYIEVEPLRALSAMSAIKALKSQFTRHGIPQLNRTDNGPQYSSREVAEFCGKYGVQHKMSSPVYPQSNGEAECADKHLALLDYCTTPLDSCAKIIRHAVPGEEIQAQQETSSSVNIHCGARHSQACTVRVITVTTTSNQRVDQWTVAELAPTSSTVTESGSRYTTKSTKTDECPVSRSKPSSGATVTHSDRVSKLPVQLDL